MENVGEWLIQTEEFRSWHDCLGIGEGHKEVLFCYGASGVGKAFIGWGNLFLGERTKRVKANKPRFQLVGRQAVRSR